MRGAHWWRPCSALLLPTARQYVACLILVFLCVLPLHQVWMVPLPTGHGIPIYGLLSIVSEEVKKPSPKETTYYSLVIKQRSFGLHVPIEIKSAR